ncbi:MAG: hypothetical protein IKV35_03100 [Clostridia bacterium]|nr:hypothetical protein [Clostridia bacterium]
MICRICGAHFEESEMSVASDRVPYGDGFVRNESEAYCPECGSDYMSDEGYCAECACEIPKEELHDGLCHVCVEEARQALAWMWGMLSPSQKRYAVSNLDWMEE